MAGALLPLARAEAPTDEEGGAVPQAADRGVPEDRALVVEALGALRLAGRWIALGVDPGAGEHDAVGAAGLGPPGEAWTLARVDRRRSRTFCVPPPAGLPDFDRSLGRIAVPQLLREAGLTVVTLAERYGIPKDESVTDEEWLAESGRRGEAILTKDGRVRYNVAEKAAIHRHLVKCFCLVRQDLPAREMADRVLRNLVRIATACRDPGPFLYAVHERRIERMPL